MQLLAGRCAVATRLSKRTSRGRILALQRTVARSNARPVPSVSAEARDLSSSSNLGASPGSARGKVQSRAKAASRLSSTLRVSGCLRPPADIDRCLRTGILGVTADVLALRLQLFANEFGHYGNFSLIRVWRTITKPAGSRITTSVPTLSVILFLGPPVRLSATTQLLWSLLRERRLRAGSSPRGLSSVKVTARAYSGMTSPLRH